MTKKNGALKQIPSDEIPVLVTFLQKELCHSQKPKAMELCDMWLEKQKDECVIVVSSLVGRDIDLLTMKNRIEEWINVTLKQEGFENVTVFYNEEKYAIYVLMIFHRI